MLNKKIILFFIIVISLSVIAHPSRNRRNPDGTTHYLTTAISTVKLNDIEKKELYYMREEEKLAHDVYSTMYKKWNQNIFFNIMQSEFQHTEAVKRMLAYYGLEDTSASLPEGKFHNKELQKLYDNLVKKGNQSLENALIVGATIEDLDILDLQNAKKQTDKTELISLYDNLEKGSRNHLRSFHRNLSRLNVNYTPQYIDKDYFNNIISTGNERGRL